MLIEDFFSTRFFQQIFNLYTRRTLSTASKKNIKQTTRLLHFNILEMFSRSCLISTRNRIRAKLLKHSKSPLKVHTFHLCALLSLRHYGKVSCHSSKWNREEFQQNTTDKKFEIGVHSSLEMQTNCRQRLLCCMAGNDEVRWRLRVDWGNGIAQQREELELVRNFCHLLAD